MNVLKRKRLKSWSLTVSEYFFDVEDFSLHSFETTPIQWRAQDLF